LKELTDVVGSEEQQLLEYREKVLAELERRANLLRDLEERVAELQGVLEAATKGRKVMAGETARIQVEAAHRARVRQSLQGVYKEREVAVNDLQKAETRLREVDIQLEEIRSGRDE
jgi:hypothetical protein